MPVTIRTEAADQRLLQITRAAADAGRLLGETIDGLIQKAAQAATLSDPKANRRYEELAFYVEDGTIYGVWPYARQSSPPAAKSAPAPTPAPHGETARVRPTLTISGRARALPPREPEQAAAPEGYEDRVHQPCNGVGCPACQYKGRTRTRKY